MEKLLCQHSLLTGKVTVSSGEGRRDGWWIESCVEGQREGHYPSGTLSGLRRQVTLQWLQSISWSSYLTRLPPLPHFYWHKSFCREMNRLFTLSVRCMVASSLSIFLSLFACSKVYYEVFKWQVMPQLTALSMTCRTLQDHTRERSLYIEDVESAQWCVDMHMLFPCVPLLGATCAWIYEVYIYRWTCA